MTYAEMIQEENGNKVNSDMKRYFNKRIKRNIEEAEDTFLSSIFYIPLVKQGFNEIHGERLLSITEHFFK